MQNNIKGFGISKTIPANEGKTALDNLYNGKLKEYEFHMAGKPSKLKVGDYVYTIFQDMLYGKLQIAQIVEGQNNPESGKSRSLIIVKCPGELFNQPIPKKGHRGTRYFEEA
ncbi:MAG: hypothetical protein R3B92_03035 [Patescibacteria group bacterium]|uniref:Uncharacterized protein n=1 Tax=candidate division WWE3 bacterium TaxID=2053526 RepID=A0A955EAG3_UNCKA|nr:hypothetical protein [candidate division WWE3 bacterium]